MSRKWTSMTELWEPPKSSVMETNYTDLWVHLSITKIKLFKTNQSVLKIRNILLFNVYIYLKHYIQSWWLIYSPPLTLVLRGTVTMTALTVTAALRRMKRTTLRKTNSKKEKYSKHPTCPKRLGYSPQIYHKLQSLVIIFLVLRIKMWFFLSLEKYT